MRLTRNLALALCSVLLSFSYLDSSEAQNLTGNVVYTTVNPPPSGAQYNWSGFVVNNTGGGGTSGGNAPAYNTQTGTFIFGYTQGTVAYNMAVNNALANAGSGIQVSGYNYSWQYFNQDFSRGTLTGTIGITDSSGKNLHSYNYTMPKTTEGWTVMSGTQNFGTEYSPTGLGNLTVSFSGKDDRYWAGYYGPQIRNIDVRLRYSVDPCITNPAYSPNCAGFNNVVTSGNLVPNPGATASWGSGINNSFAINTAFKQAGSGLQVHGFEYGFYARANDYCAFEVIWCFDNRQPQAQVNINITDSANKSLHSNQYNIRNQEGNFSNRYLFSQSQQLANLGNFNMTAGTSDNAVVSNMYSRAIYTPDLCMRNPNISPACPGYVQPQTASTSVTSTSTPENNIVQTAPTSSPVQTTSNNSNIIETTSSPVAVVQSTASSPSNTAQTANSSTSSISNTSTPVRVGEVSSSSNQSQSSVSVNQVLNIIRSEQNRITRLETTTVATAVEQATREADKATSEAQATAATQQATVIANNDANTANLIAAATQPLGSGIQVNMASAQQFASVIRDPMAGPQSFGTTASVSNNVAPIYIEQSSTASMQNNVSQSVSINQTISETPAISFSRRDEIQESVSQSSQDSNASVVAFNATNPLNNYLNPPPTPSEAPAGPIGPTVNRNVQPNQASGGRDISVIATAPPGFDAYQSGRIPDGAFYAPRDIYRNVILPDNQRTQRALNQRSDNLHREMIEQQYRGRAQ